LIIVALLITLSVVSVEGKIGEIFDK